MPTTPFTLSRTLLLTLALLLLLPASLHASALMPIKTDHARDTMRTFMDAMQDYREGVAEGDREKMKRLDDAVRCFTPAGQFVDDVFRRREAAIMLKEVIDRIIVIDYDLIPDNESLERWRLKDTEITLRPIPSGERAGEWLFTLDTWTRAKQFYERIAHLPYLEESGQGALYQKPILERMAPDWARQKPLFLSNWQWITLFMALLIGFTLKYVVNLALRIVRSLIRESSIWLLKIMSGVERPIELLIVALWWAISLRLIQIEGLLFNGLNTIVQIVFGYGATWFVYNLVGIGSDYFRSKASRFETTLDSQLIPFAEKTLKITSIAFGILLVLQNLGINVMSLLAGLGLGGLAFALAAKDTAANLFGSIMILLDRPFKVGDWINVNGADGTVEEVGFRSTRIRTFYNSVISIPNSEVATTKIDNYGLRNYRRVRELIPLTYDTPAEKIEAFVEGIKKIIQAHPDTVKDNFHVCLTSYSPTSLEVLLYFFLRVPTWSQELVEKQNVMLSILRLADALDLSLALLPPQTVQLETTPDGVSTCSKEVDLDALREIPKSFSVDGERSFPRGTGLFVPAYREEPK
jgi:MscS family membrane protein